MSNALLVSFGVVVIVTAVLGAVAWQRPGRQHGQGFTLALQQLKAMGPRVLLGILAASFIAELLPKDIVAELAGADSGWQGILLATLIGASVPTGPMVLFPVAVALLEVGVGVPQIVAFVTSWGLLAVHRLIVWEIPLMGVNFVAVRLAASILFPPLSGFAAGWLMLMLGIVS